MKLIKWFPTEFINVFFFLINSLSFVIPSNFTSLVEGITLPTTFYLKESFLFAIRTIIWNSPWLNLRELILNQSITLLASLLRLKKKTWSKVLSPLKKVLSSATFYASDFSLINMLKQDQGLTLWCTGFNITPRAKWWTNLVLWFLRVN